MVRIKRGTIKNKKRKKLLKLAKGYRWGRKSKKKMAREAIFHAWVHAYRGRKEKKRIYRRLWQLKLNAALRQRGWKYSTFAHKLKEKNIKINRQILAQLAENLPSVFEAILNQL